MSVIPNRGTRLRAECPGHRWPGHPARRLSSEWDPSQAPLKQRRGPTHPNLSSVHLPLYFPLRLKDSPDSPDSPDSRSLTLPLFPSTFNVGRSIFLSSIPPILPLLGKKISLPGPPRRRLVSSWSPCRKSNAIAMPSPPPSSHKRSSSSAHTHTASPPRIPMWTSSSSSPRRVAFGCKPPSKSTKKSPPAFPWTSSCVIPPFSPRDCMRGTASSRKSPPKDGSCMKAATRDWIAKAEHDYLQNT